jgi:tetratricopeptide (TPR) repeat protein
VPNAEIDKSQALDMAVAEYLELLEVNPCADREEFLAAHPEVCDDLRQFVIDHDAMRVALPAATTTAEPQGGKSSTHGFDAPRSAVDLSKRFGDFELVSEIARGGMGVVYVARQRNPPRTVALKMILAGQLASSADIDRFYAESRAAAGLDHPHIVPVLEVGQHAGQHYYTMSYVAGESLAQRLHSGPLPAREAALLLRDAARAVHYAHGRGVIHRDLKPANLLLDPDRGVRVTDFGLAKRQSDETGVTRTGELLGTPTYMAPEQVSSHPDCVSAASDVYSLGATLYALITGRPPFQAASLVDTLRQVADHEPAAPRQLDAAIPRDLETIALKCLEKRPERRYATAEALAEDLDRFLERRTILARPSTPVERAWRWSRRNPAIAAMAGAIGALLVVTVSVLAVSNARIRGEAAVREAALLQKDAALATAHQAVDQMLTRVAKSKLSDTPLAHPIRAELLQDALRFYQGFLAQDENDVEMLDVLGDIQQELGYIELERGRYEEASHSFRQAVASRSRVAQRISQSRRYRQKEAIAQESYAFCEWRRNEDAPDIDPAAERELHKAMAMYDALEHNWPDIRQPVGLCLRTLAKIDYKRGDRLEAERRWREAIQRGSTYVGQNPADADARCGLCWAYAELYDTLLSDDPSRDRESNEAVTEGLKHSRELLRRNPRSTQARDVSVFLKHARTRLLLAEGKIDEALESFDAAIVESQSLCLEFPYHENYWNTGCAAYKKIVATLVAAGRADDARRVALSMRLFSENAASRIPAGTGVNPGIAHFRDAAHALSDSTSPTNAAPLSGVQPRLSGR